MKIIGLGKDETVIVEMAKDELARIAGHYSAYSLEHDDKAPIRLVPGAVLKEGKMYSEANAIIAAQAECTTAATTLRNAANRFLQHFDAGKK